MEDQPLVSVIMPVYNSQDYLKESIESILGQTYKNFEFLIFDDGSIDKSREIIESYQDKRIKLIHVKENCGYVKHLNDGIKMAKGKYIVRMDSDDICSSNRIEEEVKYMESHPKTAVCGSGIKSFGIYNSIERQPTDPDYLKCILIFRNKMAHPTVIMRKSVAEKYMYDQNYLYAEDYELWARMSADFDIANVDEVLLNYRTHKTQVSQTKNDIQRKLVEKIQKNLLSDLGLEVSNADWRIHQAVASQKFGRSRDFIQKAERWLIKILEANKEKHIYNEAALKKVLFEQWFFICYNSPILGTWVLEEFRKSPLYEEKYDSLFHKLVFDLKSLAGEVFWLAYKSKNKFEMTAEVVINRLGLGYKLSKEVEKKFKIGMAILAFNRPEYLEKCLDSLFETNLYDYDVTFLIQDDGSDDPKVSEIINKSRDRKYKIVRSFTKKGGNSWGAAFNKAMKKLIEIDDFDIIGSCDSDALFHPEWLDKTMKICFWAKKNHKNHTLGPFSSFNSSDSEFHKILGEYKSPFGDYVVKERMGALNYFYFKEDFVKLGFFEENKDDETLMTEKFKRLKVRNFCTKTSFIEHIGKYSILNKWRLVPVDNAVFGLNLVDKGWGKFSDLVKGR